MGKIFPRRTTLKESPSLFEDTLRLIEKSFQYKRPYSFKEDFAPLMNPSNHHNCFIYTDENNQVVAHIGMKEKTLRLNDREHVLCLIGGIAVAEERRGEGLFRSLMEDVLSEKRSDCAMFLLWSDQEKLYKKFGFSLSGTQYEYSSTEGKRQFEKAKYFELSDEDKKSVQSLYEGSFSKIYITPVRTHTDWVIIEEITSADLYVKRGDQKIDSYFFMNKGQDLGGIIYEYGFTGALESFVKEARNYGNVWTAIPIAETNIQQFQFLIAPADRRLFADFVSDYTKVFKLREINLIKGEAFFDYEEETLSLELSEFLRGIFGPGTFEELGELPPIFISGLDSI